MGDKQKFPRAVGLAVAKELCDLLKPVTERLICAGSLRRGKAEVGDVEIVFVPKSEMRKDPDDLLGQMIPTNLAVDLIERLIREGTLEKRLNKSGHPTWGPENKLARHLGRGIGVDFFEANPRNWWSLVVCRTGSADSNTRVCMAAEQRGLKWNPYRGFEDRQTQKLLHVPQSEAAVFELVGLPCVEPRLR